MQKDRNHAITQRQATSQRSPRRSSKFLLTAAILASVTGAWLIGPAVQSSTPKSPPPLTDLEAAFAGQELASLVAPMAGSLEAEVAPAAISRVMRVERGDTLMKLLLEAGIGRQDAHRAVTALAEVFRPRELKPGQAIQLTLARPEGGRDAPLRLASLNLKPSVEREIRVVRRGSETAFVATATERPLERRIVAGAGTIESSLFVAGQAADIPTQVMIEMIRAFSYDVDFQRELRKADTFELLYESHFDEQGRLAKTGAVIYAALTLSGRRLEVYGFTPRSGISDYFHVDGRSVRKALLRTPVDGARISSRYGMRKHPVLGYSKMHRGVDFAAPRGTPVYAAGDGRIETAGRNGGYGKYVRIRHNDTYKTAYAHLNRYAKGIRPGKAVKQGQVIGYVGSTGRSTGPHLHYEVLKRGKQTNPGLIKLPSGERLRGTDFEAFQAEKQHADTLRDQAHKDILVVQAKCAMEPGPSAAAQLAAAIAC